MSSTMCVDNDTEDCYGWTITMDTLGMTAVTSGAWRVRVEHTKGPQLPQGTMPPFVPERLRWDGSAAP
eukprot:4431118-Pyramimonas_sp.AAC.1